MKSKLFDFEVEISYFACEWAKIQLKRLFCAQILLNIYSYHALLLFSSTVSFKALKIFNEAP